MELSLAYLSEVVRNMKKLHDYADKLGLGRVRIDINIEDEMYVIRDTSGKTDYENEAGTVQEGKEVLNELLEWRRK